MLLQAAHSNKLLVLANHAPSKLCDFLDDFSYATSAIRLFEGLLAEIEAEDDSYGQRLLFCLMPVQLRIAYLLAEGGWPLFLRLVAGVTKTGACDHDDSAKKRVAALDKGLEHG